MDRRAFLRRSGSLAFTSTLLSACGGGGSGDAETNADTGSSSSTASSTASNTNATISTPPGAAAKARVIVVGGGLANATEGRFAGVNVLSYASTVAGAGKVHIIGDSSATTQPKAGHIANQEAKVCADAIQRLLAGGSPDPAPVTNSACYSTITMSQAAWLTAVFQYNATTASMQAVASSSAASVGWDSGNFREMNTWFNALMADSFA